MKIFHPVMLSAKRDRSITTPYTVTTQPAGSVITEIYNWVNHNWLPEYGVWFLTPQVMTMMMYKWALIMRHTWGWSWEICAAGAKTNMRNFILTHATAVAVPALTLWLAAVGAVVVLGIMDFLETKSGYWHYKPQRAVMTYEEGVWLSTVIRHPHENVWDVKWCLELVYAPYQIQRNILWGPGYLDIWHLNYYTSVQGIDYWSYLVYQYNQMWLKWVGVGKQIAPMTWRVMTKPGTEDPFGVPVGFSDEGDDYINWVMYRDQHFTIAGEPFKLW
jgi:hypothetical protein